MSFLTIRLWGIRFTSVLYSRSQLTKEGFPDYPITETRIFPIRFAERDVDSRFPAARKLPDQIEHGVRTGLSTVEP